MYLIYKINFPSGKVYIGQTSNMNKRITDHLKEARNMNDSKVYRAMRKYNTNRDNFEIIEQNIENKSIADEREVYWISYYDSFKNGYNSTVGGDVGNNGQCRGEKAKRAVFTNEEVLEIRKIRFTCKYSYQEVFQRYSNKCSEGCFHKIWNYQTYKDVGLEYNTPEVIAYYKHMRPKGSKNKNCMFSIEEVAHVREMHYIQAMSAQEISEIYKCNKSTIERIINGKTYSDLPFPTPSFKYRQVFKKFIDTDYKNLALDFKQSGLDMKNYYLSIVQPDEDNIFSKLSLSGFVTKLKRALQLY